MDDPHRGPAVRWPGEPIADFRPGHIAFGPDPYPDLDEARKLLPEYNELWNAVGAAHLATLMPSYASGSVARQHAEFFAEPY